MFRSMSFVRPFRVVAGALAGFVAAMSPALAQAQAAAPGGALAGGPPAIMQFMPIIVMLGVAYFLMMRPQMKKQKDHQAWLAKLERGDEIITSGGILGRIEGMTELYLTLEIAPNVRIKVLRSAVAGSASAVKAPAPAEAKA